MAGSLSPLVRFQFFASRYITPRLPVRQLYQLTDGRIGSSMPSVPTHVLLLTVTGRRSGKPRTRPIVYFEIDGKLVVGATNTGKERDPQWYRNLLAQPQATVQLGASKLPVVARVAEGDERERLWAEMKRIHPMFALYERATTRSIAVIVLERADDRPTVSG